MWVKLLFRNPCTGPWSPLLETHCREGILEASDSRKVKELVESAVCYPEAYRLQHALSLI